MENHLLKNELKEKIYFLHKNHMNEQIEWEISSLLQKNCENRVFTITSRIKDFSSAFLKCSQKQYETIEEISDLVGIMIICLNQEQIYQVKECLQQNLDVVNIQDYIQNPKMGYQSVHMNVRSNDGFVYEIQLKTRAMQKAQTIIHDHIYKNKKMPKLVKRILSSIFFKIILLFEIKKKKMNKMYLI